MPSATFANVIAKVLATGFVYQQFVLKKQAKPGNVPTRGRITGYQFQHLARCHLPDSPVQQHHRLRTKQAAGIQPVGQFILHLILHRAPLQKKCKHTPSAQDLRTGVSDSCRIRCASPLRALSKLMPSGVAPGAPWPGCRAGKTWCRLPAACIPAASGDARRRSSLWLLVLRAGPAGARRATRDPVRRWDSRDNRSNHGLPRMTTKPLSGPEPVGGRQAFRAQSAERKHWGPPGSQADTHRP